MTESTATVAGQVDGSSENELTLPPYPLIRTRPSMLHLIIGIPLIAAMIACYAANLVVGWLIMLVGVVVAIFVLYDAGRRTNSLKIQFRNARFEEIEAFFQDRIDALSQATGEAEKAYQLVPANPFVALPLLVAILPIPYLIWWDATTWLQEWHFTLRWIAGVLLALLGLVVMFVIWAGTTVTPATYRLNYQAMRNQQFELAQLDAAHQNDVRIINQKANLESLLKRIDTYTLESALLSALSFSSFLSIILSEQPTPSGKLHVDRLMSVLPPGLTWHPLPYSVDWPGLVRLESFPLPSYVYLMDNKVGLIALSLLFCASTFLGVLVARLRFNDGYRDAESALRTAERLNDKEELALSNGHPNEAAQFSNAINNMIVSAETLQDALRFTVGHMRLSRDFGIGFFVLALALCGLFFGPVVAIIIGLVFVLTLAYGVFERVTRSLLRQSIFEDGIGSILRPRKG